jgi:hypothetical protein
MFFRLIQRRSFSNSFSIRNRSFQTTKLMNQAVNTMEDEYGKLDSVGETFIAKNFNLESGDTLPEAHVCRITYFNLKLFSNKFNDIQYYSYDLIPLVH